MSTELSTEVSPEIISSILLTGDISKLTANQKSIYYAGICKTLQLNPLTQPFTIIKFQGKETLYARASATQQIADVRKINTEVLKKERMESVYIVTVRATLPDGRFTDDDGITSLIEPDKIKQFEGWINNPKAGKDLVGNDLANALMRATTKAKRRAVLALCGLGLPDESELETMEIQPSVQSANGKSRVEEIVEAKINEFITEADIKKEEVKEDVIKQETPVKTDSPSPKSDPRKSTTKKEAEVSKEPVKDSTEAVLPEGTFQVIGLIDNQIKGKDGEVICVKTAKNIINPVTKQIGTKWSFIIEDKRYGTFDSEIAKKVMECIDNRRLVKFQYTTRTNDKNIVFQDIIKFEEATIDAVKDLIVWK